jgi:dolichol kinase
MTGARQEVIRKGIHVLLSLVAATVVWRLPPLEAATVLAGAALVALTVEVTRRTSSRVSSLFQHWLAPLLRTGEHHRLTGATTLALGYTLASLIFPGTATLLGILVAGIGDAVAAVIGKRFGRVRYPGGKSLEGSLAFLVVVLLLLLPLGDPGRAGLVAFAITVLEAPDIAVDDNLYLPLATAALVHTVYSLPSMTFFS